MESYSDTFRYSPRVNGILTLPRSISHDTMAALIKFMYLGQVDMPGISAMNALVDATVTLAFKRPLAPMPNATPTNGNGAIASEESTAPQTNVASGAKRPHDSGDLGGGEKRIRLRSDLHVARPVSPVVIPRIEQIPLEDFIQSWILTELYVGIENLHNPEEIEPIDDDIIYLEEDEGQRNSDFMRNLLTRSVSNALREKQRTQTFIENVITDGVFDHVTRTEEKKLVTTMSSSTLTNQRMDRGSRCNAQAAKKCTL